MNDNDAAIQYSTIGHSVFITGVAGTGKSYTLCEIIKTLKQRQLCDGEIVVCASTGIAALPLGGTTVHSWGGLSVDSHNYTLSHVIRTIHMKKKQYGWKTVKTLIIDEISLIGYQLWELIESVARYYRDPHKVFGGIQIIACGDFLQLPPVQSTGDAKPRFCFETDSWRQLFHSEKNGRVICLQKVYRFLQDTTWTHMLDEIRMGDMSMDTRIALMYRIVKDVSSEYLRLYPRRNQVDKWNKSKMEKHAGNEYTWSAIDIGNQYNIKQLDNSCLAPRELQLKIGVPVLLLTNLNFKKGLVNGKQGTVVRFIERPGYKQRCTSSFVFSIPNHSMVPVVQFGNNECVIDVTEWSWGTGDEKVIRQQLPLMLAYSITIHKAQGMTLDNVIVDLHGIFESGQAYVALSRVRCLDGLNILQKFDPSSIRTDVRAKKYWEEIKGADS